MVWDRRGQLRVRQARVPRGGTGSHTIQTPPACALLLPAGLALLPHLYFISIDVHLSSSSIGIEDGVRRELRHGLQEIALGAAQGATLNSEGGYRNHHEDQAARRTHILQLTRADRVLHKWAPRGTLLAALVYKQ